MTIALTSRDLRSVRQLLLAMPDPEGQVLPRSAVDALVTLVPCDAVGAGETDATGYLLRGFDEPSGLYDHLGPQVCAGPIPTGLRHLAWAPVDDPDRQMIERLGIRDSLQVGFRTSNGTVVQCYLDRFAHPFTDRDVALLRTVEPALGRLMLTRTRLRPSEVLTPAEQRILELVSRGLSNQDVAEELAVTTATVRKHLENSYRKLGVASRTAAVATLLDSTPV